MIYLVSDPHGGQDMEGLNACLSLFQPGDLILILGDMELHFRDTQANREFTKWFESLGANIAFIDGNHENFDHLYSLPVEYWNGGKVHRLSPSIVHLMRGQIYDIGGKTFFTMGGCKSTQKWKDAGLWWPQEDPSADEIGLAYENLKKHGNHVDYVLSHKYALPDGNCDPMTLAGLTRYIEENVSYTHWYSGHWHKTAHLDAKHTFVFQEPFYLE